MTQLTRRTRNGMRYRWRDPFDLMNELMVWDPFGSVGAARGSTAGFSPRFDVRSNEEGYVIKADVPGLTEEELEVTLADGRLTVSGTRKAEERKEEDNYTLFERQFGSFTRAFDLPSDADVEKIEASLADGVFSVSIPKRAEAKPRKIRLGLKGKAKKSAD